MSSDGDESSLEVADESSDDEEEDDDGEEDDDNDKDDVDSFDGVDASERNRAAAAAFSASTADDDAAASAAGHSTDDVNDGGANTLSAASPGSRIRRAQRAASAHDDAAGNNAPDGDATSSPQPPAATVAAVGPGNNRSMMSLDVLGRMRSGGGLETNLAAANAWRASLAHRKTLVNLVAVDSVEGVSFEVGQSHSILGDLKSQVHKATTRKSQDGDEPAAASALVEQTPEQAAAAARAETMRATGLSEHELADYREIFELVDSDKGGSIDANELGALLRLVLVSNDVAHKDPLPGHGPWVLVLADACYWHGVGGNMFNSSSS